MTVGPAAAASLQASNTPTSVTAGNTASVKVTALDSFGNTATGYLGTIAFSSDDSAAVIPADYTFLGGDAGVHIFNGAATVALRSAGTRHITVTDSALASPSATSPSITVDAAAADHLAWVGTPGSAIAGTAFSMTLHVEDLYGNAASAYAGTVTFSTSDGAASVPAAYTFTGIDAGVHAFTSGFTLKTVAGGAKTITASDNGLPAGNRSLTTSGIAVSPAAASQLALTTQPAGATAGSVFGTQPVVSVQDAYGNTVTGNSSSVTATLNTGSGALAGTTTVAAVNGIVSFSSLRIDTAGAKTLQFTDGALTAVNSGSFTVSPAAAATLQVASGTSQTAGTAFSTTVTAKDAFGNTASGYLGTVHFTSSDPQALLPSNYSFLAADNGTHTFTNAVTLKTAGAENLIATDTITTTITGTQNAISVTPAAANRLA